MKHVFPLCFIGLKIETKGEFFMPKHRGVLRIKKPQFYQIALILFLTGAAVGLFFARGIHLSCPAETTHFFRQIGENLDGEKKAYLTLFEEILEKRLQSLGLLLLFSISILGLPYIGGFLLYKGCISGFLIGSVLFQFGTNGILLAVSLFFPQCFLYLPAYFSILSKGYRLGMEGSSQKELIKEVPAVFTALALMIVGSITEAYVNTWILERIYPLL